MRREEKEKGWDERKMGKSIIRLILHLCSDEKGKGRRKTESIVRLMLWIWSDEERGKEERREGRKNREVRERIREYHPSPLTICKQMQCMLWFNHSRSNHPGRYIESFNKTNDSEKKSLKGVCEQKQFKSPCKYNPSRPWYVNCRCQWYLYRRRLYKRY